MVSRPGEDRGDREGQGATVPDCFLLPRPLPAQAWVGKEPPLLPRTHRGIQRPLRCGALDPGVLQCSLPQRQAHGKRGCPLLPYPLTQSLGIVPWLHARKTGLDGVLEPASKILPFKTKPSILKLSPLITELNVSHYQSQICRSGRTYSA